MDPAAVPAPGDFLVTVLDAAEIAATGATLEGEVKDRQKT